MVLHDLNLAARFADYMIAIKDGKIIKQGLPKEIMTPKILRETFNIKATIIKEPQSGRLNCLYYELLKNN